MQLNVYVGSVIVFECRRGAQNRSTVRAAAALAKNRRARCCRYQRAQIYTYVGAMLLVVNPFKDLKLTTNEKIIQ